MLCRIATNAFFDLRRKRQTLNIRALEEEPPQRGQRPEQAVEGAELNGLLMEAIGQLPEKARVVFLLRTQEELSFREIAEIVGASEETARWHMHQARSMLIAWLDGRL